jgi:hypothetical protein
VAGEIAVPDGHGSIEIGALSGNAHVSVDFASTAVTGSLTGMTVTDAGSSARTPWNDVTFSGNFRGATFNGTAATGSAPAGAGAYGLSGAATGRFDGEFYGPTAQEVGAVWSLHESTADGGKSALGVFGATKQ